jgi:ubiquinone/menaquinone biosynthesis C-methylase UbiE
MKLLSIDLLEILEGNHVLDVGCGVGDEVRLMAKLVGSTGRAVGVDQSVMMVTEARRRTQERLPIEFQVGDIYHLDFPDNTFDGCRAERVFQHLDDPHHALAEMIRVAKPGARIVVMDPDWETLIVDSSNAILMRKICRIVSDHLIPNGRMGRQLIRLFHNAGLDNISVTPYVALARKAQLAAYVYNLNSGVQYGQRMGLLTQAEAEEWYSFLRGATTPGGFFAALDVFIVRGRKPARRIQ